MTLSKRISAAVLRGLCCCRCQSVAQPAAAVAGHAAAHTAASPVFALHSMLGRMNYQQLRGTGHQPVWRFARFTVAAVDNAWRIAVAGLVL
jgi:hypothetical protein